MRGAPLRGRLPIQYCRIIPADAGSTPALRVGLGRCEDHPRGCGEHYGWAGGVDLSEGSSPRMRGAPMSVLVVEEPVRIIPADAGSTVAQFL